MADTPRWRLLAVATLLGVAAHVPDAAFANGSLDEIVVTATRLPVASQDAPVAVTVIEGDALTAGYQQIGLDEALTGVPGLFIQDRYNFAQDLRIAIRGFGARSSFGIRGVRLLVDDIPLTLPDGQGQLDSLDLASTGRVDVVRGPAAALYGNAGGGLLRISTETVPDTPFVRLGAGIGADGFQRYRVKAGGRTPAGALLVSASTLEFDGYRDHARTRQHLLNTVLRRAVGASGELAVTLNIADQPLAEDPGGVNAASAEATPAAARAQNVSFNAGEALQQVRLGVSYRHALADDGAVRWRLYGVERDFDNRLPFTGGGQVQLERRFVGGGVELSRPVSDSVQWLAGLDIDDQRDDRERFDNLSGVRGARTLAQREAVRAVGAFASLRWVPAERWALNIGARYDWLRFRVEDTFLADGDDSGLRRFRAFNPVAGLTVDLSAGHQLFANAARSFETPTTTEFANPAGGGFNPALEPALARSVEAGWRWRHGARSRLTLSVYRIDLDDELVPFELPTQPDRDFFSNAGTSRRDGVELEWRITPHERVDLAVAVSGNDFRFRSFVDAGGNDAGGERTPGIPRHVVAVTGTYRFRADGFVALDVSRIGTMTLNNTGTDEQAAYTVMHLRTGVDVAIRQSELALYAGINNVTDEAYPANVRINAFGGRYFEPAPERYAYAGFDWRFAL